MNRVGARHAGGQHADQRRDRPGGGEQAGGAAHRAEQEAFGQELADEVGAGRAKRGADGDLALALRRARQQQAGDVRARDQQHETDGAEQHQERGADAADDLVAQRLQPDGAPRVGLWKVPRLPLGECLELGARRREARARLQAGEDLEVVHVPLGEQVARHVERRRGHDERREHPDARVLGIVEGSRHDAEDRVRHAVDLDPAADDRRVACQLALPDALADDDQRLCGAAVGRGRERPAHERRHREDVEVVGRDARGRHALRLASRHRDRRRIAPVTGHRRQRLALPIDVEEVGRREAAVRIRAAAARQPDDRPAVGVGQRPQQNAVDDAEDGRVGADAEREGQDRDDRKCRRAEQRANGVTKVIEHGCAYSARNAASGLTSARAMPARGRRPARPPSTRSPSRRRRSGPSC